MAPAIIYKNILLYQLFMRMLYGRHFEDRYKAVAAQIPSGSSVMDICAGDAYLYTNFLKHNGNDYLAIDNSPFFINSAQKRNIACIQLNVSEDPLPVADVVVMMASLYQFIPHEKRVIQKLLDSARKKLVITEPISNLSASANLYIRKLAQRLSIPFQASQQYEGKRFDRPALENLFRSFKELSEIKTIPGERELMGIFYISDTGR
jgi:hypothetical protein